MIELLNRCNTYYANSGCCHTDGRACYCYPCLQSGFYGMPDHYDCQKKLSYYVLNYGPSFASEIYHYLSLSRILETFVPQGVVNILSLGCGFAPDLIAIEKYIQNNNLQLRVNYTGIDASDCWQPSRFTNRTSTFHTRDVTTNLDVTGFDIVFIVKLFSTLLQNHQHNQFIQRLQATVANNLVAGSYLIFNDINSRKKGRDIFHNSLRPYFNDLRQYYFSNPPYHGDNWIHIPSQRITFDIPVNLAINPLREIRNNVMFEYRK